MPKDHPLRPICAWLNDALKRIDEVFARMCEADVKGGRPSIARENLVRALLLQVLYPVRSERMRVEQISYNMLVRRPTDGQHDMGALDVQQEPRPFTSTRCDGVALQRDSRNRTRGHLSWEPFSVAGTLIQARAGHKSFVPKARPDEKGTPPSEPASSIRRNASEHITDG